MSEREDANRLMLERIELTKRRDAEDEVRMWRDATPEQRAAAIIDLSRAADKIVLWRGFRDERPPLAYPRLRRFRD